MNEAVLLRTDDFDGPKAKSDSFMREGSNDEPVFEVWEEEGIFDFTLETNGALRPEELFRDAIKVND